MNPCGLTSKQEQESLAEIRREDAENKIREDYQKLRGQIITLNEGEWIYGYYGNTDVGVDVKLFSPVKVKVEDNIGDDDLLRYMGQGWIDPVYSIEVVEGSEQTNCLRSCWIHGKSYNYLTGETQ